MWGFAKKGRLNILLLKQKKAIRKVYNLKYRDHTHNYFIEGKILKLPDLIKHSTICYMQKGLNRFAHPHISRLWTVRQQEREDLRDQSVKLSFWKCDPPVLVVLVKASAKVVGATPKIGLCNLSLSGDSVLLPPNIPNPTILRNTTSKPNIVVVE